MKEMRKEREEKGREKVECGEKNGRGRQKKKWKEKK